MKRRINLSEDLIVYIVCFTMVIIGGFVFTIESSDLGSEGSVIVERMRSERVNCFRDGPENAIWSSSISFHVFGAILSLCGFCFMFKINLSKMLGLVCLLYSIFILPWDWDELAAPWMILVGVSTTTVYIYFIYFGEFGRRWFGK